MPNPAYKMGSVARLLLQELEKTPVGDTVEFKTLSAAISEPVNGGHPALRTAMRRLMVDQDMVFTNVRGVGVKRIASEEIVNESSSVTDKIRRTANRGFERLMRADFDHLANASKLKFTAQASTMAAISQMTTPAKLSHVEKRVPLGKPELPLNDTLKMFMK
jgi:hypothetical protein